MKLNTKSSHMNVRMIKISACALFLMAFGADASAQETATATATATIVTPITITKTSDLSFGNLAVQASTPGTAVISPAGVVSATAGVTIPGNTGTTSAATFTVAGESGYSYSITLPGSIQISNGAITMSVDNFTSTPTPSGTLTGGSETLKVGATLTVAGGQAPGVYTSASPFSVIVNYN